MTRVTCSPVDALPSGPSSRFRRCSCAIAHAGEKCNPIIGTLRYIAVNNCLLGNDHLLQLVGIEQ